MQNKLAMMTVGLIMGYQIISPPLVQSIKNSSVVLGVLAAGAAVGGIVAVPDDKNSPDQENGTQNQTDLTLDSANQGTSEVLGDSTEAPVKFDNLSVILEIK